MKKLLRKLFAPILEPFEFGDQAYVYKASHRLILFAASAMFLALAALVIFIMQSWHYFLPVVVFGGAGLLGIIIASLGDDRAVAKIWGSK